MSKYFLFIITAFTIFISCKKSTQTASIGPKNNTKNSITKHKKTGTLNTSSLKEIDSWKEYHLFSDFMKRYENISPNEAFDNVPELKDLTKALKDSLTIKDFKTPSFRTRLNVLNNEVLRLSDMSNIPAITTDEVNNQIDKIFLIYSSLNDKINTVFYQKKFEEEINLDDFFNLKEDENKVSEKKKKNPISKKKKNKKNNEEE